MISLTSQTMNIAYIEATTMGTIIVMCYSSRYIQKNLLSMKKNTNTTSTIICCMASVETGEGVITSIQVQREIEDHSYKEVSVWLTMSLWNNK